MSKFLAAASAVGGPVGAVVRGFGGAAVRNAMTNHRHYYYRRYGYYPHHRHYYNYSR